MNKNKFMIGIIALVCAGVALFAVWPLAIVAIVLAAVGLATNNNIPAGTPDEMPTDSDCCCSAQMVCIIALIVGILELVIVIF